ncbi:oligosaccharide flippase family protein [Novosphingobium pituita]|uniref:O-antigen/teichoic acid export membrane protein n=1 Tax=Novosphingobium pituita TaxID=3056842 RepID=A0ABQ6PA44_9SPHN|nr:oligosaccharide flippase family protein [Novosphingobium sp. IK01]GMM61965.1 hypothetical protein NUTIK01_27420 [Novosphingobium sp. IK01]
MLIRQTLLYLPAQIVAPLVQFASILVWARLMTPRDLGVVTLTIAVQEVYFALFFGWWQRYVLRFVRTFADTTARRQFLGCETLALLASGAAQSLAVVPLAAALEGGLPDPAMLALVEGFMITRSTSAYFADRARAEARIALYSLVQTCGPMAGFAIGVLLLLAHGSSAQAVLLGFLLAQGLGLVAALAMSDALRRPPAYDRPVFHTAIAFGGAVMIATLLATLAFALPRFIVSGALGMAAMGTFAVGYGLGLRASSFAVTLVTAGAYPLVVRRMEQEGIEAASAQLRQNMVLVALAVMPVACGLLAINRLIIDVLVESRFREATASILPLATIGGLFRYLRAHTSDQVFALCLRPGYGTAIAALDIVVAAASTWIGLRWLGLAGAALGPMISGLCTLLASFALSRRRFGFHAPLGTFARILAAATLMGLGVRAIPLVHTAPMLLLAIGLGVLFYGAALGLAMPREARGLLATLAARLRARRAQRPA